MEITREFLLGELARMKQQRDHAHDVFVAHQAAMDVLESLLHHLTTSEVQKETTFADLGLPDPQVHSVVM
jgi:hypothetical protein